MLWISLYLTSLYLYWAQARRFHPTLSNVNGPELKDVHKAGHDCPWAKRRGQWGESAGQPEGSRQEAGAGGTGLPVGAMLTSECDNGVQRCFEYWEGDLVKGLNLKEKCKTFRKIESSTSLTLEPGEFLRKTKSRNDKLKYWQMWLKIHTLAHQENII